MSDFTADGNWALYSMQKTLPGLGYIGGILGGLSVQQAMRIA